MPSRRKSGLCMAKKKELIKMFFPSALGARMVASYFNPLADSYAFIFVLLSLRI
jgi:hypothetical protein